MVLFKKFKKFNMILIFYLKNNFLKIFLLQVVARMKQINIHFNLFF